MIIFYTKLKNQAYVYIEKTTNNIMYVNYNIKTLI